MLDVMNIEQEIFAYQVEQGTYQGKQGISRVTKLSLPRKRALLEELRKEYGPLSMNIPKAVL
jgi:hypothetical protein